MAVLESGSVNQWYKIPILVHAGLVKSFVFPEVSGPKGLIDGVVRQTRVVFRLTTCEKPLNVGEFENRHGKYLVMEN